MFVLLAQVTCISVCTSFVLKGFTSFKRNLKTVINHCFPFQLKKWGSVFKYLYIGSINFVFCVTSLWRPKLACMHVSLHNELKGMVHRRFHQLPYCLGDNRGLINTNFQKKKEPYWCIRLISYSNL